MELLVEHLKVRRAGRTILNDLTFGLEAGRAAALRGPNGAGKSTLIRALAGLLPLAGGDARLGEISLAADRGFFQEHVAYGGHLDAVKPGLTVAENLGLWAALHGGPGREAAALERFGLTRIAARPAVECSAGQKRRLGLARLLVADKPLWILDEPTVSLDRDAVALVAHLVAEHIAEGGLALIATHVDLGLDTATVELTPTSVESTAAEDAFLAGDWG
ncbi:MAG: heme ABC exporter ATP-binding protein CcmA [Pseudomonadota bacterium]